MKVSFTTLAMLLVAVLSSSACGKKETSVAALPRQPYEPEMIAIPNQSYEMGKYEITQGQWKAVMGNNPSHFKDCGDTCPVENVSWNDIQVFIQQLNAKTNKSYRLPMEAEWQAACLAGNQTEYCGGSDVNTVAWHNGNSGNTTNPVGQKSPNAYGLYDMSGNVAEWMQDKFDNKHDLLVMRGGSWFFDPKYARAVDRFNNFPAILNDDNGFRLARTLP